MYVCMCVCVCVSVCVCVHHVMCTCNVCVCVCVKAKHRYSDFHKLRSRLKRIIKGEKKAQKAQKNSRQPSVNQFVTLPPLPPKKLFSQSGIVSSLCISVG